jgi:hypothetical protein
MMAARKGPPRAQDVATHCGGERRPQVLWRSRETAAIMAIFINAEFLALS